MEKNIIKIKEENKKNDSDLLKNKIEGTEKHEVLFSDESSSLYSSTRKEASWKFDYEINSIRFGEEKDKEYMYILEENKLLGDKYKKLDPSTNLVDTIFVNYSGEESQNNIDNDSSSKFKANILKTLVSKKKEEYKMILLI